MSLDPTKEDDRIQATKQEIKTYDDNFASLDYEKSFSALFELLWYAQMPCFDVKGRYVGLNMNFFILENCELLASRLIKATLLVILRYWLYRKRRTIIYQKMLLERGANRV